MGVGQSARSGNRRFDLFILQNKIAKSRTYSCESDPQIFDMSNLPEL
jgi:hypothetical protein